jgi:hypothetical protein
MTGELSPKPPDGIDTRAPNPARIYDYLLGGKDHYPADRQAAEAVLAVAPQAREGARENRAFLQRAVRYLAEAGVRQFLDIGTGLPTQGNVHQVAQAVMPEARVVYVDHDPVVHTHANALLTNNSPTTVAVIGDLREPEAILDHPEVRRLLDFTRPIAVLLVAVLHFIRDAEDPAGIVTRLRDAMAPGSYLVVSHATGDFHPHVGAKSPRCMSGRPRRWCCAPARRSSGSSTASTWSSRASCSPPPGGPIRGRSAPAPGASTAVSAGSHTGRRSEEEVRPIRKVVGN